MSETAPLHVVAAIFIQNGKVLAFRRAKHKTESGLWEFPGGKVESGEASKLALKREISEELGFACEVLNQFDISDARIGGKIIRLETYICEAPIPVEFHSTDHDDIRWVSSAEASALSWAEPDLPALQKLKTQKLIS